MAASGPSADAATPAQQEDVDTVTVLSQKLAAVEMTECDEAAKYLISAILGFKTDNPEWNKTVLVARVDQTPQEIETRLRYVGIVDPDDVGDSSDSRIAGYFVTLASRVIRLATYKTVQLEFFGHCVLALTSLYAVRVDAINSTYPDVVLNVAEAMVQFLKKAKLTATKAASKASAAGSAVKRGSRLTTTVPDVDPSQVTAETVATLPHVDGIRKAAVSFLHIVKPHLQRLTRSILEDDNIGQDVKDDYVEMNVAGSVTSLLAEAGEFEATIEDQWSNKYAVASAFIPLFVAPLFIICAVAGALLFWSPIIYPPTLIMFPALRPIIDLAPQWEWVRYALSALSAFSIIGLVFYMANFSPGKDMPRAAACVHSFLVHDGDVMALYQRQAGEICVRTTLLSGDATSAAGALAAASPTASASASGAPVAGAAGALGQRDSSASGGEGGDAVYEDDDGFNEETMQLLGFSPDEAQQAISLFDYATSIEGHIMTTTGTGNGSGNGASTSAAAGGAGAAPAPADASQAAPPSATVLPVPESLLGTLYSLYHRLEEVGEAETADAVLQRITFIEGAITQGRVEQFPDSAFEEGGDGDEEGDGDAEGEDAVGLAGVAGRTGEPEDGPETPTSVGVRDD